MAGAAFPSGERGEAGGLGDEVETLLRRCSAFAALEDDAELPADMAELSARLAILGENQGLSLRNIL